MAAKIAIFHEKRRFMRDFTALFLKKCIFAPLFKKNRSTLSNNKDL